MFERLVRNIVDILMALTALMADDTSLFLTHIHFVFNFQVQVTSCQMAMTLLSVEWLESSY